MNASEMTDAIRRGLHRPASEQCWCIRGKINPKCRIHAGTARSEPASAPLAEKPVNAPVSAVAGTGGALVLAITGQIVGGKNNICITKSGKRFPKASWAKWRDAKVREVSDQLPAGWQSIKEPVAIRLDYVAGDRRRRDQPAIIDAIFHVLEKSGFCADDTFLWISQSTRSYSATSPRAVITLL